MRARAAVVAAARAVAAAAIGVVGCTTPDDTAVPPGENLNAYDAVSGYGGVAAFAGPGAELIEMTVVHARSDGTVDLEAKYAPRVEYELVRPDVPSKEDEALPVGARGKSSGFEAVNVTIRKPAIWSVTVNGNRHDERHLGMDRRFSGKGSAPADWKKEAVPPPTCSLKKLWAAAIEAGAPRDAVAEIRYDEEGWRFRIADVDFELRRTGADCSGDAPSKR